MIHLNIEQIESALQDAFNEPLKSGEQRKIVFWVDKDQEFIDEIDQMTIDDVQIQKLTDNNQFYMKHLLEEEDTLSHYLIYTNLELNSEENWLYDIMLYSKTFFADRISLIISDLHIDPSLRMIIKKYEKFFNNKERFKKFQAFGLTNYTEESIELAIMSVLCGIKTPDFESVLKMVLMDTLEDAENKYMAQMEKFFDLAAFWKHVEQLYGYEREKKTLKTLFIHLTVTALSHAIKEEYLAGIKDFIAVRNRTNSLVFIDHWRHHKTDYAVFDEYAAGIEIEINLLSLIQSISVEEFKQADIFPYFDKAIIIKIANSLLENLEDFESYTKLIKLRRVKHYYDQFSFVYEALYYTVKMHEFYKEHKQGLMQGEPIAIHEAYVKEYYVMDMYYRKFYVAFDENSNNELLKKLKSLVENLYTNWFVAELNTNWSQAVKKDLTSTWSLPGVRNQQSFYSSVIAPHIRKGERVFVIISDAMRYEVGVELAERLNAETIGDCDVSTLLGVVPSVTKLGMAALLPHNKLDFDASGRVMIDGTDSSGLENRKKILESYVEDSIAVHFQDVLDMNKAGRRETFKGKKLIYFYHDTIDAMGDKASTEIYAFNAVEKALDQLSALIKVIRDDLSGSNVYITADHGFLYQREELPESDKLAKEKMDVIEVKRRHILSKEQRELEGQIELNLSAIVQNEEALMVYLPNGTIRNRLQGAGVNFVHGGASLQEVIVPLLTFKNKRAGQKGVQVIQKVDIKLTNTIRKITNSIFNLEFFQTEKVEEKFIPRTVLIYMTDDEGSVLSNEETLIGDRTSDKPEERTFKLQFALKSITYDRAKTYYLNIKDIETGVVIEKIPFSINLGIVSDFDF